jgi:hypothetical protein
MILCPVCSAPNHHLAIVCVSCKGYIQQKIDNLDLFHTLWTIIESPRKGFHTIALSQHKNYSLVVSGVAGIGLLFTSFWLLKVGDRNTQLINILIAGLCIGFPFGICFALAATWITKITAGIFGNELLFRDAFAVISYSLLPIAFSAIFILPLEVMTFGIYLFTRTPSPGTLYPVSFAIVCVLDAACGIWTILLYVLGLKVLMGSEIRSVLTVALVSVTILSAIFYFLYLQFR